MRQSIGFLALLLVAVSALVSSSAVSYRPSIKRGSDGIEGHKWADFSFTGSINGIDVSGMSGSVENILSQLESYHPGLTNNLTTTPPVDLAEIIDSQFQGRNPKPAMPAERYCCPVAGQDWDWAIRRVIAEGIRYLSYFKGICHVPARTCTRVSCSYDEGIYMCNDNYYDVAPTCTSVSVLAQDLYNHCSDHVTDKPHFVCGQKFDDYGFNVIIHVATEGC